MLKQHWPFQYWSSISALHHFKFALNSDQLYLWLLSLVWVYIQSNQILLIRVSWGLILYRLFLIHLAGSHNFSTDLFQVTSRNIGCNSDQASHACTLYILKDFRTVSVCVICQNTSSHPPPSPSVWPLLSLLVDVIVPLCSHFTMAILHLSGWLSLSVSPSACHLNVCFFVWVYVCLLLSFGFNLNWELGMQNGMSEIELYLSASSDLSQCSPRSLHVTP